MVWYMYMTMVCTRERQLWHALIWQLQCKLCKLQLIVTSMVVLYILHFECLYHMHVYMDVAS